jgi:hypothetical protein
MKINATLAMAAIAAAALTTTGAFANDLEFVQISNVSGEGGPISFHRPVQRPRANTVAVYAARRGVSTSATAGHHQKSQGRWETIPTGTEGGQVTVYHSAQ